MKKRFYLFLPFIALVIVGCGGSNSTKMVNRLEVSVSAEDNVNEMIEHMERFHEKCEGESMTFKASGERTAIVMWDNKYPAEDIDEAIEKLKSTLLTDSDIDGMKFGYLVNKGSRVIK